MVPRYPENSTDVMLESIRKFNRLRPTSLNILRKRLEEARKAADVILPARNERDQPVKHGCRTEIQALVNLYETLIWHLLRIDGQDRLVKHGGLAKSTDGKWAM